MTEFQKYIKDLQSISLEQITEHSKRSSLENLLNSIASDKINILHEPKREAKFGAPDFKISNASGIIGYIENKKIDENLDKILKSEQIKKYKELSNNILITNYLEWIWVKDGEINGREQIAYISDIENKKFKPNEQKLRNTKQLIENFFSQAPIGISTAKELAKGLANRSKNLRDFLTEELKRQEKENTNSVLRGLYATFKTNIFNELSISDFADAFAQMLSYGLFLAKLNADTKEVNLYNAKQFIPSSFELIKELVNFLEELNKPEYKEVKWIVEEVISLMNNLNLYDLQKDLTFSKSRNKKEFQRDPYIYFYEDFLASYDSKLRKAKGVYYTPPAVVNFIVRAINDILHNEFKIAEGLANSERVTVLDFATGTGTFILEILQQIIDNLPTNSPKKELIIKEHILKNVFGFEYLIAPYTIAHLKLSQFLKDNNYNLNDNERFQVFLTNTLEPILDVPPNLFVPTLSKEGEQAQKIKDKPILVICGNPPYSYISKNNGDWITNILKGNDIYATQKVKHQANYFEVDGKKLQERNPKGLQDDYVKFIRFAQYKMDKVDEGVVGIITNHSFLDNSTFRGMRQSLLKTFDQLYFIDLHGNAKKKEITPEGTKDENVFDIEQGVAISIMVKKRGLPKKVYHSDMWGLRKEKYKQCYEQEIKTIEKQEIKPQSPFHLFIPKNYGLWGNYERYFSLKDIFKITTTGVKTHRDHFAIAFEKETLKERLNDFKNLSISDAEIEEKYKIKDTRDWKLSPSRKAINNKYDEKNYRSILYRPFDKRVTYFDEAVIERMRRYLMQNFDYPNIALVCVRQAAAVGSDNFDAVHVIDTLGDTNIFRRGGPNIFPLYIYSKETNIFQQFKSPDLELTDAEQKFEIHKNAFDKAIEELNRHEKKFSKLKNPTQTEIDGLEEHRMSIEEYSTSFEIIKQDFEKKKLEIKNKEQLLEEQNIEIIGNGIAKQVNFTDKFQSYIKDKYKTNINENDIIGYIYSILHCPTYQEKYVEFLNIDYPRIPFVDNINIFNELAELGTSLIQAHLLSDKIINELQTEPSLKEKGIYTGNGDNTVEKVQFSNQKLFINKTQYFENVSENVFNYLVGGYPVLDKYLKERKEKTLTLKEINNIENTVKVLEFTLTTKQEIDKLVKDLI